MRQDISQLYEYLGTYSMVDYYFNVVVNLW